MPTLTETSDAANSTATIYSMGNGDYFFGSLSSPTESDWVEVTLAAGQTYTFALVGVGALDDSVDDTYLRLRDSGGAQIRVDDDDGPGLNSTITFTASSTGTYYLDVQSWNNSAAGDYGLSMVTGTKASYDVAMGAGVLIRADVSWSAAPGTPATVTWGIRASGTAYDASGNAVPFEGLSAAQVASAQGVMAMFDGVSGLALNQVNPGGTTNSATILLGSYNSNTDGSGAYAYYPGSTAASADAGDVWLNNNSVSQTSLPPGSFSHFAIMHEIGHALGLSHPGDYNAAPGTSISYANNAQFIEDTHQYTVMSYFDESNTTTSFGSYPDTLLLYDIYALHQLYGADMSFHAGNTTYGFNATVGGAYDFTTNSDPVLSIWDGSGTDTLDLSGYGMAQIVDLGQGQFSDIGGYTGNLSIAIGAVIENVVGGTGNDTITGNGANNRITGGTGSDTFVMALNRTQATVTEITGGYRVISALGTDTLIGVEFIQFQDTLLDLSNFTPLPPSAGPTSGNDVLFGTSGNDSIDLLAGGDSMFGGGGQDTLRGDNGNDTLFGEAGNDLLEGGANEDRLNGGTGQDTLRGDSGHDTLLGGDGDDQLDGGWFNDWLYGEGDNDLLRGDGGVDRLFGGNGDDTLEGGDGNDVLWGDGGNDFLRGGANEDWLNGGTGNDMLYGDSGHDTVYGAAGDDLLDGGWFNDWLYGGFGRDTLRGDGGVDRLFGDAGNDTLLGGNGNDILYGGANNDRIDGGAGNDLLSGGAFADVFVFVGAFGDDTITDFDEFNNIEDIDLGGVAAITDYADLLANHMTQVGADVVIDDGGGNTITVLNVNIADMNNVDFTF